MTFEAVLQVLLSGLLMGLIYALMAAGLSLIFGLMDVVNFAHGEFLMVAMYLMFGLTLVTGLDPLVLTPIVVVLSLIHIYHSGLGDAVQRSWAGRSDRPEASRSTLEAQ